MREGPIVTALAAVAALALFIWWPSSDPDTILTVPVTPVVETYTVQPGDTLWAIAEEHLGDPLRWREIQMLNALPCNGSIVAGSVLEMPR